MVTKGTKPNVGSGRPSAQQGQHCPLPPWPPQPPRLCPPPGRRSRPGSAPRCHSDRAGREEDGGGGCPGAGSGAGRLLPPLPGAVGCAADSAWRGAFRRRPPHRTAPAVRSAHLRELRAGAGGGAQRAGTGRCRVRGARSRLRPVRCRVPSAAGAGVTL